MKKTSFLLRIGICTIIIGLTILLANIIPGQTGSMSSGNFSILPNGTYIELLIPLHNRAYEFRITVPKVFEGTFYLLNYEGIRKLAEGTKTPILKETIKGPTLIDFTINRRGTYMILIESNVSEITQGSIGIIEKEGLSQDILQDATIIIILGIAITAPATLPKITWLRKCRH